MDRTPVMPTRRPFRSGRFTVTLSRTIQRLPKATFSRRLIQINVRAAEGRYQDCWQNLLASWRPVCF